MNEIIQNILACAAIFLAVGFLVKKYLWKTQRISKTCGKDDCGCH